MKASTQELIEATLAWCNEQREKKGDAPLTELPKGHRFDPNSCPCGKATGLFVERSMAFPYNEEGKIDRNYANAVKLPPLVSRFTRVFDDALIPELIDYSEEDE